MSEDSKSKPNSDSCSTSVIIYLIRDKSYYKCSWIRICETNCPADPKASEEEGGSTEVLKRFPCSLWRRLWWGRLSPCSPWSSGVERYPPAAPGGPHTRAAGWPKVIVTLWEADPEAGSWQDVDSWREQVSGPMTSWAHKLEQAVPEELHHLEGVTLEQLVKNWSLLKDSMLEKFMEDLIPLEGTPCLSREACEESCFGE